MTKKRIFYILILMMLFSINSLAQKNKKQTKVLISTEFGNIKLVLYNETPKHRDNFIKLVKEGFYDSTIFHRVMKGFMIQGGDPDSKKAKKNTALGNGGPGYTVPSEFKAHLIHKRGSLAAARQPDYVNPEKASSGSQFYLVQGKTYTKEELDQFILDRNLKRNYTEEQYKTYETVGGTPQLDGDYTVFGEVIEGLDVIDKIADVETGRHNRPKVDVRISMKIVKK